MICTVQGTDFSYNFDQICEYDQVFVFFTASSWWPQNLNEIGRENTLALKKIQEIDTPRVIS